MDRSLPTQDDRNCRMTKIKPLLWGDSEPYFFLVFNTDNAGDHSSTVEPTKPQR